MIITSEELMFDNRQYKDPKHRIFNMAKKGRWNSGEELNMERLKELLYERFAHVDFEDARANVERFLTAHDRASLSVWGEEFFRDITRGI